MRISLFGSLADAIGREVELPLAGGIPVAEVRRQVIERYPEAASILRRPEVRACLGDRIVGEDETVPAGAELAFFPPLSGG